MWDSCFTELKLDYEATKNLGIGDVVMSDEISAGGDIWRIRCYPHGLKQADKGVYLSIFLRFLGKSTRNVTAIFDTFLMNRDGTPSLIHSYHCVKVFPPNGCCSWGYPQFVKRSDLESDYVTDGQVRIMCGVIVFSPENVDNPITVPPSDMSEHFGCLLDHHTDSSSDVSFSIAGETFPAHRAVLAARSLVFRAQLFGPMADAKMPCITLHDIQPSTFKILLRFMYTDALPRDVEDLDKSCSSTVELLQNLLAAADMYHLDRLKLLCAAKLWACVSAETVATMLCCAETHGCQELKTRCLDFFVVDENFKVAVLTEGYFRLMQSCPSVIDEIRARVQTKPR
ncbi:hypothetical protein PR202_ga21544 [Eleusine coracana subsp. coracana]|uniref:Uncharacterized protein n=1 Tax=Eleusine coracana subsp. coracana TaxID=191504 RepID=A0AAV5CZD2_ELECO|nr:hypothetical protein QOZ80_8AG0637780 [Eleusine coracana subsp. coracana]GJN04034.1 hypothetical protein PR202_ga21544 [Eleusine coracana subsp. coracana]